MLDRKQEYERMADVEMDHWWYQTLHSQVLNILEAVFPTKNISILNAGCGTGGLLLRLQQKGYKNILGFDLSESAVKYRVGRGLVAKQCDLRDLRNAYPGQRFDVIISNDTLYFLQRDEIGRFMNACSDLLNQGGLLICNLPAMEAFSGTHDVSVGIRQRFSKRDIKKYFSDDRFGMIKVIYWPLLLSPVIFIVRAAQRVKTRLFPDAIIHSDIDLPPVLINRVLALICRLDIKYLSSRPFGSSLFLVLKKK